MDFTHNKQHTNDTFSHAITSRRLVTYVAWGT